MAHEVETMAYAGETPWHGLGNQVQKGVSVERMAIEAGLEWEVDVAPVVFQAEVDGREPEWRQTRNRVLYRKDTGASLDIVGPNYVPVQNMEILEFFREYVDAGDMYLDTAGALDEGRFVWALARMDQSFDLGNDLTEGYVLLANPHQYGKGMIAKFTSVRVVCMNTLSKALAGGGGIKLWHTKAFDASMRQEAKRRLGIARDQLDAYAEEAHLLTQTEMDEKRALKVLSRVFGNDADEPLEKQPPTVRRLMELFNGAGRGSTLPSAQGTAWGLLHAVTEYHDWEYGKTQDSRLHSAWLGAGDVRKRRTLTELLAVAAE